MGWWSRYDLKFSGKWCLKNSSLVTGLTARFVNGSGTKCLLKVIPWRYLSCYNGDVLRYWMNIVCVFQLMPVLILNPLYVHSVSLSLYLLLLHPPTTYFKWFVRGSLSWLALKLRCHLWWQLRWVPWLQVLLFNLSHLFCSSKEFWMHKRLFWNLNWHFPMSIPWNI